MHIFAFALFTFILAVALSVIWTMVSANRAKIVAALRGDPQDVPVGVGPYHVRPEAAPIVYLKRLPTRVRQDVYPLPLAA